MNGDSLEMISFTSICKFYFPFHFFPFHFCLMLLFRLMLILKAKKEIRELYYLMMQDGHSKNILYDIIVIGNSDDKLVYCSNIVKLFDYYIDWRYYC